jgi:hypothetical protein
MPVQHRTGHRSTRTLCDVLTVCTNPLSARVALWFAELDLLSEKLRGSKAEFARSIRASRVMLLVLATRFANVPETM